MTWLCNSLVMGKSWWVNHISKTAINLIHNLLHFQCDGIPGGPSGGQKPKLFSYNVVFEPGATQDDVLQFSGIKRLIEMGTEGFSCTAFCYGQTGSGKTHTLTGPPELVSFACTSHPLQNIYLCIFTVHQKTKSWPWISWLSFPCVCLSLQTVTRTEGYKFRVKSFLPRNLQWEGESFIC